MPRGSSKKANPEDRTGSLSKYMPSGESTGSGTQGKVRMDWGEIDPEILTTAIASVTNAGGAILFGADRARVQFAVTLFFNGQKNTFYWFANAESMTDMERWFWELIADLSGAPNAPQGG